MPLTNWVNEMWCLFKLRQLGSGSNLLLIIAQWKWKCKTVKASRQYCMLSLLWGIFRCECVPTSLSTHSLPCSIPICILHMWLFNQRIQILQKCLTVDLWKLVITSRMRFSIGRVKAPWKAAASFKKKIINII